MSAITFSKQWIHFLRSDLWPPTSTILQGTAPFQSSGPVGTPRRGTPDPGHFWGMPGSVLIAARRGASCLANASCAFLHFTPVGQESLLCPFYGGGGGQKLRHREARGLSRASTVLGCLTSTPVVEDTSGVWFWLGGPGEIVRRLQNSVSPSAEWGAVFWLATRVSGGNRAGQTPSCVCGPGRGPSCTLHTATKG